MKKIIYTSIILIFAISLSAQTLYSVQTDKWTIKGYTSPKMIFETKVYQDSITVKLIKGNSKAMDKLIGTPKFTKVFIGTVEISDTEYQLRTKGARITVTRGTKIAYTTVEEKDDFTDEVTKNVYFGKR